MFLRHLPLPSCKTSCQPCVCIHVHTHHDRTAIERAGRPLTGRGCGCRCSSSSSSSWLWCCSRDLRTSHLHLFSAGLVCRHHCTHTHARESGDTRASVHINEHDKIALACAPDMRNVLDLEIAPDTTRPLQITIRHDTIRHDTTRHEGDKNAFWDCKPTERLKDLADIVFCQKTQWSSETRSIDRRKQGGCEIAFSPDGFRRIGSPTSRRAAGGCSGCIERGRRDTGVPGSGTGFELCTMAAGVSVRPTRVAVRPVNASVEPQDLQR